MSSTGRRIIVACLVGLVGGLASGSFAQEQLPTDLVMTTTELTAAQTDSIRLYANRWAGQLLEGKNADAISEARNKLLEPLKRPSAGEAFVRVYSTLTAASLGAAPQNTRPLVRLNAMVVVGMLRGPGPLELAAKCAGDANTGVRYWAAKAVAEGTGGAAPSIDGDLTTSLTAALVPAITAERDPYVREQFYLALGGIRSPQARKAILTVVDQRLQAYATQGLTGSLRGEVSGLQRAQQGLVIDWNNRAASLTEVRQFVTVVAKYLQVVAHAAQQPGGIPEAANSACGELVDQAQGLFNWTLFVTEGDSGVTGPKFAPLFKSGQPAAFALAVYDWVGTSSNPGLLQRTKINISLKDLAPPASPKPIE